MDFGVIDYVVLNVVKDNLEFVFNWYYWVLDFKFY